MSVPQLLFARTDATLPNVPPDLAPFQPRLHEPLEVTNATVREKRSRLFDEEKQRQTDLIPRVEKIDVKYVGVPEDATLILNKNLSTPFDVAQRKQRLHIFHNLGTY